MAIAEILEDIELAFCQLEFSIRLLSYCELGKLDPKELDDDHFLHLDGGDLHFPAGRFASRENVQNAAGVGVLLTVSATALALNRGFDEVGPKPDPTRPQTIQWFVFEHLST
jgi:hypothetical protein